VHRVEFRSHVRRLQVLQSKCLRLATVAPWYVSNRHIHEDMGFPLFADHIRALTAGFDSKLADVGNPLVRQHGQTLGYRMQSRGSAPLPLSPVGAAASPKRLTKFAHLQFATEPVRAQNPDNQPTKVIPPINRSVPLRHRSLVRSIMALNLTSNCYRKHIPLLELRCL
jgi:hypothetical protein